MYEVIQIGAKLIIIVAIVLIAAFASFKVWKADLDLSKLFSPSRIFKQSVDDRLFWLPTRERNTIYQSEDIVGKVTGASVDEEKSIIEFQEISQSADLDLESEFEFQKWKLRFQHAETIGFDTSRPQDGRLLFKVTCKIVGERRGY